MTGRAPSEAHQDRDLAQGHGAVLDAQAALLVATEDERAAIVDQESPRHARVGVDRDHREGRPASDLREERELLVRDEEGLARAERRLAP